MSSGTPGTVTEPSGIRDDFRQVLRCLPQPVAVVSGLSRSGKPVGMTVSSLTSVSLTPPLLLFCPAVTSSAWAAARERGLFAVNVLGHKHHELALQFAGSGNRFERVRTHFTEHGIPLLADALTVLICEVDQELQVGDHFVVLARVRAIRAHRDGTGLDTVSLRENHANATLRHPPRGPWTLA